MLPQDQCVHDESHCVVLLTYVHSNLGAGTASSKNVAWLHFLWPKDLRHFFVVLTAGAAQNKVFKPMDSIY
jgi:hypothetical protein